MLPIILCFVSTHFFEPHRIASIHPCIHSVDLGIPQVFIDIQQLEKDLRSFGLLKIWKIFAYVAVNFLGLPEDECPLYDAAAKSSAEKAMGIVWTDGNFGRYSERSSKRPEGYSSGKIHSMIVTTKRYFRILPVYPSHILSAWVLYFFSGIYHYCKGLFE